MSTYQIRVFGDPVLKQRATEVTEINGSLARVVDDMVETMYQAPGIGLAAPQVGIQKRFFVFDIDDGRGPQTLINPEIVESHGEWTFEEGCLSVPGMYFPIIRPKQVLLRGLDLDGNPLEIEADELLARLFQHELDHLDGTLLLSHLDDDQRKQALRELRRRALEQPED